MVTQTMKSIWMLFVAVLFATIVSTSHAASEDEQAHQRTAVATVNTNNVEVGETLYLSIAINERVDWRDLDLSPLEPNFVFGNINPRTSYVNINGESKTETVLRIPLRVIDPLTTEVPALPIDGLLTQPIPLNILAANEKIDTLTQDVLFKSQINATTLYPQQSAIYTMQVIAAVQVEDISLTPPSGEGLTVETFGEDKQYRTVLNGRSFAVLERQYRITADYDSVEAMPDDLATTLQSATFSGTVPNLDRRGFSTGRGTRVSRSGENYELSIRAIPSDYEGVWLPTTALSLQENWQPDSLNRIDMSDTSVTVGDAITREITLAIDNREASLFPNINIQYPSAMSVYDERPEFRTEGNTTIMTLKQVLIPRQAGEITLPGMTVNWWDSENHQAKTAELSAKTISINAAPAQNDGFPDTPILPSQTEVIEVKDAGWWPMIAATFALLWVVTLGMWWKSSRLHHQVASGDPEGSLNANSQSGTNAFEKAVQHDNPMEIQRAWRSCNPTVQHHTKAALNDYLAACYRKTDKNPSLENNAGDSVSPRQNAREALATQVKSAPTESTHTLSALAAIAPK